MLVQTTNVSNALVERSMSDKAVLPAFFATTAQKVMLFAVPFISAITWPAVNYIAGAAVAGASTLTIAFALLFLAACYGSCGRRDRTTYVPYSTPAIAFPTGGYYSVGSRHGSSYVPPTVITSPTVHVPPTVVHTPRYDRPGLSSTPVFVPPSSTSSGTVYHAVGGRHGSSGGLSLGSSDNQAVSFSSVSSVPTAPGGPVYHAVGGRHSSS